MTFNAISFVSPTQIKQLYKDWYAGVQISRLHTSTVTNPNGIILMHSLPKLPVREQALNHFTSPKSRKAFKHVKVNGKLVLVLNLIRHYTI
jgi:hypothetical protein